MRSLSILYINTDLAPDRLFSSVSQESMLRRSAERVRTTCQFVFQVWDLAHGSEITGIEGDKQSRLVRFSPDGVVVIIGCKNDRIFIWDWQNYDVPIKCIILPAFTTMEIACDRNMIYTCSRNNDVCQFDLGSLQPSTISQGPNPTCTSMVILPDGEAILSGITTYSVFIYWELSSWREIRYNAGTIDIIYAA